MAHEIDPLSVDTQPLDLRGLFEASASSEPIEATDDDEKFNRITSTAHLAGAALFPDTNGQRFAQEFHARRQERMTALLNAVEGLNDIQIERLIEHARLLRASEGHL